MTRDVELLSDTHTAIVMAGIPDTNNALYHRLRFSVGDPTALVQWRGADGAQTRTLLLRDIEMQRAKKHAQVEHVHCPADFEPEQGLSGDRETATAQAAAECLRRQGIQRAICDRSLPLIYADLIRQAGIGVSCDLELGVTERRSKDAHEVDWLREAQAMTERAMEMACRMIAQSTAGADGVLMSEGSPLTSERVSSAIDVWLMQRGYDNPSSIVAGGPQAADCHHRGEGPLRTGQPVIVDIFPQNRATRYNGDCTRTVVHGTVSEEVSRMHAAVVLAKQAASDATRAGVTGEDVHLATSRSMEASDYGMGLPPDGASSDYCAMTHGTGHGIGLDVHEPPLLDRGGPKLVSGDALTIEPGLYSHAIGGVRVEDMVIVTDDGCLNLNRLPEGLNWD